MKKIKILIASVGILLVLWIASWFKLFGILGNSKTSKVPSPSPTAVLSQKADLSIIFDDGKKIDYSKEITGEKTTAFSILKEAADQKSLALVTKQYDFGVFVESIEGEKSGANKSWIYFVNGQSGQIAADKYELKQGDKVEWKYVVPEGQ